MIGLSSRYPCDPYHLLKFPDWGVGWELVFQASKPLLELWEFHIPRKGASAQPFGKEGSRGGEFHGGGGFVQGGYVVPVGQEP